MEGKVKRGKELVGLLIVRQREAMENPPNLLSELNKKEDIIGIMRGAKPRT